MIWFVAWHLLAAIGVWCLANGAVVVLYCAVAERARRRRARWSARDDRLVRREYAAQRKETR